MPNWCENRITLKGSAATLNSIYSDLTLGGTPPNDLPDPCSLLSFYVPLPKVLEGSSSPFHLPFSTTQIRATSDPAQAHQMRLANRRARYHRARRIAQTGHADWYEWAIANWSVKWPDDIYHVLRTPKTIRLRSVTPWGPPVGGLAKISSELSLSISLDWFECGMAQRGVIRIVSGTIIRDEVRPYSGSMGG